MSDYKSRYERASRSLQKMIRLNAELESENRKLKNRLNTIADAADMAQKALRGGWCERV